MELVRYDAMCRAIAECHSVDEVCEIQSKVKALEEYARQARNTDAERKAAEIRLRAEKRAGALYSEMERSPTASGGDVKSETARNDCAPISEYREALERTGVSERTAQRWQELSRVPDDVFEDALRDPEKPTTTGILKLAKDAPKLDPLALWVWGRMRDFERDVIGKVEVDELLARMTDGMLNDVRRIAPILCDFFGSVGDEINPYGLRSLEDERF